MPKYDPSEYDRNMRLSKAEAEGGELLPASEEGTPGLAVLRGKEMMRRMLAAMPDGHPLKVQLLDLLRKQGHLSGGELNDARAQMRSGR